MVFSRNLRFEMNEASTMGTLESCLRLVAKAEQELNIEQEKFEISMGGIPESLSSLDDSLHPPEIIDTYWDLYESFPNIRRKTEVINAYSILEHGLKSLCSAYKKALEGKDVGRGWYLDQARKYLQKEEKIAVDLESNKNWKEISSIKFIRNALSHNDGVIEPLEYEMIKYIQEHPNLRLDRNNQVLILSGYAEYCYATIHEFFIELFSICPKYNKAFKRN